MQSLVLYTHFTFRHTDARNLPLPPKAMFHVLHSPDKRLHFLCLLDFTPHGDKSTLSPGVPKVYRPPHPASIQVFSELLYLSQPTHALDVHSCVLPCRLLHLPNPWQGADPLDAGKQNSQTHNLKQGTRCMFGADLWPGPNPEAFSRPRVPPLRNAMKETRQVHRRRRPLNDNRHPRMLQSSQPIVGVCLECR